MSEIKNLEEIRQLVRDANLDPADEGHLEPLDAMRDLRQTSGRSCGENGFGHFLGIRNTNRDKSIRAYYEVRSNINGPWQDNATIGPGQTEWITCSYPAPNQYMSVHITGARYEDDPC